MLMLLSLAGSDMLALADGERNPRRNEKPVIDLESEVTSSNQIGKLQNSVVILCPLDNHSSDMSTGISGEFTATARSRDESIATAATRVNARNHVILDVTAGANDTEQDKVTSIDLTVVKRIIETGIPNRGEGRGPHAVPLQNGRTENHVVQARVLAKRKCDAIAEQERQHQRVGQDARPQRAASSGRAFSICVGGFRRFDMNREIRSIQQYQRRRTTVTGAPAGDIQGLWIKSNTNPNVAAADVFGRGGNNNLQLLFSGFQEGNTTIVTEEHPILTNVLPFSETWNITVEPCDEETRRAQSVRSSIVGYELLPAVVPQREEETMFGDEFEDADRMADEPDDPNKKHSMVPSDKGKPMVVKNEAGLVAMETQVGDTAVTMYCPSDAQAGDAITCSVISDDPELVNPDNLVVEVESTAVFQDDEAPEKDQSWVSMTLPTALTQAAIVLKDKTTGAPLCHGTMPVASAAPNMAKPAKILFPSQSQVGKPMVFKGPFTEPVRNSHVAIDGHEARILAKSPRSMVVHNPTLTDGPKNIVVKEGMTQVSGPVQMVHSLPSTRNLANMPTNLQGQQGNLSAKAVEDQLDPECRALVDAYKSQMRTMVDRGWKPPKPPTKGTWTATLEYNLMKNHTVQNVRVMKPSGYAPLDQSAMGRVQQLAPQFAPLPQCFTQPYLPIEHSFKVIYR